MYCTYNITLRRVRAINVAVEKQCVTYSEYVFVALVIQHAQYASYYIVICGLAGSTIFSHFISWPALQLFPTLPPGRLYNIFPLYLLAGPTIFFPLYLLAGSTTFSHFTS